MKIIVYVLWNIIDYNWDYGIFYLVVVVKVGNKKDYCYVLKIDGFC